MPSGRRAMNSASFNCHAVKSASSNCRGLHPARIGCRKMNPASSHREVSTSPFLRFFRARLTAPKADGVRIGSSKWNAAESARCELSLLSLRARAQHRTKPEVDETVSTLESVQRSARKVDETVSTWNRCYVRSSCSVSVEFSVSVHPLLQLAHSDCARAQHRIIRAVLHRTTTRGVLNATSSGRNCLLLPSVGVKERPCRDHRMRSTLS